MATPEVYSPTTISNPKSSWFLVPSENLDTIRFGIKIVEVLLSFVAFILEEVVNTCTSCTALYFFEFVSCTAFLFTLLLVIVLSTVLQNKVGITIWPQLDFVYTAAIALLFSIASITFASNNGGRMIERIAVVFGFIATAAFLVDLFLFWKNRGFPFTKNGKSETSNGGTTVASQPEAEKLTSVANGQ